jgi:hypothetical protein
MPSPEHPKDTSPVTSRDYAEEVRKRYLYRRLILRGKLRLPPEIAARLIGPDCAYHLYSRLPGKPRPPERPPSDL